MMPLHSNKRLISHLYYVSRLFADALRLHGREDDLNFLKDELVYLKKGGSQQDAILVAGVSGVGKSALVARGIKNPAEKMGVAYASGKFDLNKNALPFSAFAGALSELTKHVMAPLLSRSARPEITSRRPAVSIRLSVNRSPFVKASRTPGHWTNDSATKSANGLPMIAVRGISFMLSPAALM